MLEDSEMYDALTENQERRVEVTMEMLNDALVYIPVTKKQALVEGFEYRLNVEIGQPTEESLMTGEIASIDAVLPDPQNEKGHWLDVIIFEKDFALNGVRKKILHLPRFGATKRVKFYVTAPSERKVAELRIMIFHENNLLQSFLLEALVVATREKTFDEKRKADPITVKMDASTTSRFSNLDSLKPRDLYIGMNSGVAGTHQIYLKDKETEGQVDMFTEKNIEDEQAKFGAILLSEYFNGTTPRFDDNNQPGAVKDENYYAAIRNMADFGADFYRAIRAQASDELKETLKTLRESANKSITAVSLKNGYFFPWSAIYDYTTPPPDGQKYPVCSGKPFAPGEHREFSDKGFGCPHNPDIRCYCEQGFWGIRHKVEQLLCGSKGRNSATKSSLTSDSIFYSYNIDDAWTQQTLASMTKRKARIIQQADDLIDLLWDDQQRPSSLVVFGHMQLAAMAPEPAVPRILTFYNPTRTPVSHKKFIYNKLIDDYWSTKDEWKTNPLPLILMVNCRSNEFDIKSINTIVGSFWTAGAAAIISTNCNIATGLGRRFIEEMLISLYDKNMQLGDAIQAFNQNMFDSGIPLPFVFTAFGNINLTIK